MEKASSWRRCRQRTFIKELAAAFAMLCSLLTVVGCTEKAGIGPHTMAATVVFVDAQDGILWLKTPDDTLMEIPLPSALIEGLNAGDGVEIIIMGHNVTNVTGSVPRETISAQVQRIDPETGLLRLWTTTGSMIELKAPAKLLASLPAGEKVKMAIRKS